MEEKVPSSNVPLSQPPTPGITPEMLEMMKARAREEAIRQTIIQQQVQEQATAGFNAPNQPRIIYVRRNLTVAELILIIALACGLVTGVQASWNFASNILPRVEIKSK